jgi:hypothetical protein
MSGYFDPLIAGIARGCPQLPIWKYNYCSDSRLRALFFIVSAHTVRGEGIYLLPSTPLSSAHLNGASPNPLPHGNGEAGLSTVQDGFRKRFRRRPGHVLLAEARRAAQGTLHGGEPRRPVAPGFRGSAPSRSSRCRAGAGSACTNTFPGRIPCDGRTDPHHRFLKSGIAGTVPAILRALTSPSRKSGNSQGMNIPAQEACTAEAPTVFEKSRVLWRSPVLEEGGRDGRKAFSGKGTAAIDRLSSPCEELG